MPPRSDEQLVAYRTTKLEEEFEELNNKINLILTNHLPHIQKEISDLREESRLASTKSDTRINVMTSINVAAVIIGILVTNFILK